MLISGFRAAKQVATHGFKVKHEGDSDDSLVDAQYAKVLKVEMQISGIKVSIEAYLKSLVEMCWSADQLATKFSDYYHSEPGVVGQPAAAQASSIWKELQGGAQRSLEVQFTAKVLQPVAAYLGEIGGIKKLHDERQKRLLDYDYYRRKVTELQQRKDGVRDMAKITKNAEKLSSAEAAYLNVKNELLARMNALLNEKWDFSNAPLLQLLDFQQNFYANFSTAVMPLAAHTYEQALLDAEPPAGGKKLRATSDYVATDPRMLSFSAGEVMTKEKEEGGWFFGTNSQGQQGFFPGSYVEPFI